MTLEILSRLLDLVASPGMINEKTYVTFFIIIVSTTITFVNGDLT